MNTADPWERFKRCLCVTDSIGLSLDVSRMNFPDAFFDQLDQPMRRAFDEMASLEAGEIANPDESRMVGHYWLRAPELAPTDGIRAGIVDTVADIHVFASAIHDGDIRPSNADRFTRILSIGIGGSALGPQFVTDALGGPDDKMIASFCDNTDPDGIDRTLARIGSQLNETLTLVTSKSGGTKETRNAMLEVRHAYEATGLPFDRHAVAITGSSGALHDLTRSEKWLTQFPMWDWVGGRTSQMSAVGLVPAALQGYDIDAMLAGAAACDAVTRVHEIASNPAALLALMWYHAGQGVGTKDMVIIPYKDRLALLSQYLQQLVMESLGKKLDRDGRVVHQGITVYGHKGSTDQHAYVQQLRDGLDNYFVTFIEVLRDRRGQSILVDGDATSGDFLHGFLLGTRQALHDAGRESITITIDDVSARSIGVLIALFERAVGFYATLINVNAYNQPGVEAGKQAAEQVLALQCRLLSAMRADPSTHRTPDQWSAALNAPDDVETVFKILNHLAANSHTEVTRHPTAESDPLAATFGA